MSSNNNDSNEFTYLFNCQSIDGWRMAGPGKFVFIEYGESLRSEGGMGSLLLSIISGGSLLLLTHISQIGSFAVHFIKSFLNHSNKGTILPSSFVVVVCKTISYGINDLTFFRISGYSYCSVTLL
jgi:hypothetical protein